MSAEFMSLKGIMNLCGIKSRYWFRKNYIVPALAENAIERLFPNEPNNPKQMYKLTDAAIEWKKNHSEKGESNLPIE
jgi:ATP-dependent DNA helicase RecG